MKKVDAEAFYCCMQLKNVLLNDGLETLGARKFIYREECEGEVFFNCETESIKLLSTLKRIENRTFESCAHLKSVEIPNGVEYVEYWGF